MPQRETTPFHPRSPYACAKVYAHWQTINYREGLRACLPPTAFCSTTNRRGAAKISSPARSPAAPPASSSVCRTSSALGNLDARRDWGFAGDYVEAMWLMLQQEQGRRLRRRHRRNPFGAGFSRARVRPAQARLAQVHPDRPALPATGRGRPAAGRRFQGAAAPGMAAGVNFEQLVEMMVEADLELAERERRSRGR